MKHFSRGKEPGVSASVVSMIKLTGGLSIGISSAT
jgi:hypothetical protein